MKWNNPQSIPKDRTIVGLIDPKHLFKMEPYTIIMQWDTDMNAWCQTLDGNGYFWHDDKSAFRIKGWTDIPSVDAEIAEE